MNQKIEAGEEYQWTDIKAESLGRTLEGTQAGSTGT